MHNKNKEVFVCEELGQKGLGTCAFDSWMGSFWEITQTLWLPMATSLK